MKAHHRLPCAYHKLHGMRSHLLPSLPASFAPEVRVHRAAGMLLDRPLVWDEPHIAASAPTWLGQQAAG